MTSNSSQIEAVDFTVELEKRYFAYALSTITSRSLPDVRDGLKPVHRRLLYAMLQLKLDPDKGLKKCARVVGDVIGKYHPHGDGAVYDALVRMAQTFAMRYPMIEGQGNFGSIDGDAQAAMRYTEARLTPYAMLLLRSLYEDTVNFRDNYDASENEPVVLPAVVPNILANGCEGIAVGMATSIPPHNLIELCKATLYLITHPTATSRDIMKFIPAPDFPTGGVIIRDDAAMQQIYETGRGSFRLRARWHREELTHGQYQLVITEIPYQTQKRAIIEKMAELYHEKKLPLLDNFQDMSAEDIRIILTPRNRMADAQTLMESLFKLTTLEVKVHVNMNVLDMGSTPKVMNLVGVLQAFLAHRREVETRALNNRLRKINERLQILQGLLLVYQHLDEVIRILRQEDDARNIIMARWQLDEIQVEAILNMRLRSIRKLEETALKQEYTQLLGKQQELEALLASVTKLDAHIASDMKQIIKTFSSGPAAARRSEIVEIANIPVVSMEEMIEPEPLTIFYSELGWIRASSGHQLEAGRYKAGDAEKMAFIAHHTDKILCCSNYGKVYTLLADKINRGKGFGEPLRLMFDLQVGEEIIALYPYQTQDKILFISKRGKGFVVQANDLLSYTKNGKQVMKCAAGEAVACIRLDADAIALLGENRRLLIIDSETIPIMSRGQGVTLQKYRSGGLLDVRIFNKAEGLRWKDAKGAEAKLPNLKLWCGKRGDEGRVVLDRIYA